MKALIAMMALLIPTQDTPDIRVVEIDPATVQVPAVAWLSESFEQANDDWIWCEYTHRTDWPASPNGRYHAYFGGYTDGMDGLLTSRYIYTGILKDPQVWCWDWSMRTTELPYRIDVAQAFLYELDGNILQMVWERDNRDADGQWRRFCVEIYGLSNFSGVRFGYLLNNDFSNATSLHVDNIAWVADQKIPAPGPEKLYLPLSMRGNRQYQKCRVCQILPSGDTTTVCNLVDSCAGSGGYPDCPALPGPWWRWLSIEKYCVRY